MQTKFKRHQKVRLLVDPDPEYIEFHTSDAEVEEKIPIKKGMIGVINILLPNGQYHVEIQNEEGDPIAYFPMTEENLKAF